LSHLGNACGLCLALGGRGGGDIGLRLMENRLFGARFTCAVSGPLDPFVCGNPGSGHLTRVSSGLY
jgi:hypothetical protein